MENIYLKLDGIDGESTSKQAPKHIEVTSFSHGVSMAMTGNNSDVGRTTGRTSHFDFTFSKRLDKTTPVLNKACSGGETIKTATIRVFGAMDDGSTIEYYNIKLKDVLISNISVSGGGMDRPHESIAMNYNEIEWTYIQHNHDTGGKAGNVSHKWSLQTNTGS